MNMKTAPFVFFLILHIFFSLVYYKAPGQDIKEVKTLSINEKAPDFHLRGTDDKMHSLNDFNQYEILVIIFTCNHCPTAQAYEDKIKSFVKEYEPRGVGFIAIMPNSSNALSLAEMCYSDLGDDFTDMKIRGSDKDFNFPYLYDGLDQKVSIQYGPVATPHVFVFDKNRKLKYSGRIDDTENPYVKPVIEDLKNCLNSLLNKQPVQVETTKTFGCSIKWAWKDHWKNQLIEDWSKEPVNLDTIDSLSITSVLANKTKNLILINVWATWCGPCIIEFPELININRMYRVRNFEMITISADRFTARNKVLDFLVKNQASCKNYIFEQDDKYKLIEAVDKEWQGALPYSLLIAPGGNIIFKEVDAIDPIVLKKRIINYLGRYSADDH
jgi:thiol-disulfide isomerase/thioredoxin